MDLGLVERDEPEIKQLTTLLTQVRRSAGDFTDEPGAVHRGDPGGHPGLRELLPPLGATVPGLGSNNGGAVLELHSYSCTAKTAQEATERMRAELAALWPETVPARVVHCTQRLEAAAPAFPPGGPARPGVRTDAPGVRLAGDYVTTPYLSGLMERAAMSGVLAANDILAEEGAAAVPIRGVPQRGLLAGLLPARGRG